MTEKIIRGMLDMFDDALNKVAFNEKRRYFK